MTFSCRVQRKSRDRKKFSILMHNATRVNMTQTDEANDIVSAIYALQLCVFYLIYLNKGRWERYPVTPSYSRYRSRKDTINNSLSRSYNSFNFYVLKSLWYLLINIYLSHLAQGLYWILVCFWKVNIVTMCSLNVKVGFCSLHWNNREYDWVIWKSFMKHVTRIEQCSVVKTVARDF